jgi:hypothetical protein
VIMYGIEWVVEATQFTVARCSMGVYVSCIVVLSRDRM